LAAECVGEIRKGTTVLAAGRIRHELEKWLEADLPARFGNRVLPIKREIAEIWGAMAGHVKDFSMVGIPVVNPWEPMSGTS